jgi:hypothetical protein
LTFADEKLPVVSSVVDTTCRTLPVDGSRAAGTVPDAKLLALSAVRFAPDIAGRSPVNVPVRFPVVVKFSSPNPKVPVEDVIVPLPFIVTLIFYSITQACQAKSASFSSRQNRQPAGLEALLGDREAPFDTLSVHRSSLDCRQTTTNRFQRVSRSAGRASLA